MFRSYDGSAVAKDVDSEELDLWLMRQTLGNNFSTGGGGVKVKNQVSSGNVIR